MAASVPQPPAIASRIVPLPEPLHHFWISLDDLVADVLSTPWGAVVTDARFPDVWDTNYARVDVATEVSVATIEADLLPALVRTGAQVEHVVSFHHEAHGELLAELSARGHRISWDLAMVLDGIPGRSGEDIPVEELMPGDELWSAAAGSMRDSFGIEPAGAVEQRLTLERAILAPAGKRWFAVRDDHGRPVSLGTLLVLAGTGYVDNVATDPAARGRGYAGAVVTRIGEESRRAGADGPFLLCDPGSEAIVRFYERLGFSPVGFLASTKGPIPDV
ncbi:MAG: GNAT family N-acetyltransferase [Actinobacteria bacterium]|nr:MAG: GNAT family N-acetyltransferase [Actinomycetota bacterium]